MLTRATRDGRERSGITLTEILISIMIMGIGVISLATLFPLGLIRLRNAQRNSRSGFLVESAAADLGSRNLLSKSSFLSFYSSPWYTTPGLARYDPWVQDTPAFGLEFFDTSTGSFTGAYAGIGSAANYGLTAAQISNLPVKPGPGLPVAYDPLWRAVSNTYITTGTPASEARFGSGIGVLPNDPNPGGASSLPSAHGLQRVTNLIAVAGSAIPSYRQNYSTVVQTFVSPEDVILQDPKAQTVDANGFSVLNASPLVPDLANKQPENDWRFSWMFTGQQSDASNGFVFDGDIVIFENRQFSLDSTTIPGVGTITSPAGERVVQAIWGYSTLADPFNTNFGNGSNRSVLLRWPTSLPDPDVKVGGWIADVTYERVAAESASRAILPGPTLTRYPLQRCYWYQVAKKTDPITVVKGTSGPANTREMTVFVTTPLRAKTPLNFTGSPVDAYHVESALIAPSVVNVFPRTVYTR